MTTPVYESDPDRAPDTDFVPGELSLLVAGNRGRLLDTRRTPITVVAVTPDIGAFVVEINGFEDAGAHWELPLPNVTRFQFTHDASRTDTAELARAAAKFDHDMTIDCDPAAREETEHRINEERRAIHDRLTSGRYDVDLPRRIAERTGVPALYELCRELMAERGIAELDDEFATVFVSNPASGELVKGHAIVLAELGLYPYHGGIVRNQDLFGGTRSKAHRANHIIARMALQRELWSMWGRATATVYRGTAVEGPLPTRSRSSFVSTTLSRDVATAHFDGGPTTTTAVLWRQDVPIERLFMTYLETPAMNDPYAEAEALLLADPGNRAF